MRIGVCQSTADRQSNIGGVMPNRYDAHSSSVEGAIHETARISPPTLLAIADEVIE
jgi:hypothetical protein